MAYSTKLYRIESVGDPSDIQKVDIATDLGETGPIYDYEPKVVEMSDLEQTLEIEAGRYKLGNVSVTIEGAPKTLFTYAGDEERPFVFEIVRDGTCIFHGPVQADDVTYNERTKRTAFTVHSWESKLKDYSVPARSIFEAEVYNSGVNLTGQPWIDIVYDADLLGELENTTAPQGFVIEYEQRVPNSDATYQRRARIMSSSIYANGQYLKLFPEPVETVGEEFTIELDELIISGVEFPDEYHKIYYLAHLRDDWERLSGLVGDSSKEVQYRVDGTGSWRELTHLVVGQYYNPAGDLGISQHVEGHIFYTKGRQADNTSETHTIEVRVSLRRIVPTGDEIKIYGKDAWGYAPFLNGDGTEAFKSDQLITALFSLEDFAPLHDVLFNVSFLGEVDADISILSTFPDDPLEALRGIQNTTESFLRVVPFLDGSDLPRISVELVGRNHLSPSGDSVVQSSPFNVIEWTENPVEKPIKGVVVKAREEINKPADYGTVVGVWTKELEEGTWDRNDKLNEAVPNGPDVIEVEVLVKPAYAPRITGDAQGAYFEVFGGGGEQINNDATLHSIARDYYRFYTQFYRSFEATYAIEYPEIIGTYMTTDEGTITNSGLVTQSSVSFDGTDPRTTVEGRIGDFLPRVLPAPVARITGPSYVPAPASGTVDVTFTSAESFIAPWDRTVTYVWELDSGSGYTQVGTDESLTVALGAGTHTLRLTITNATGSSTDTHICSVEVVLPPPSPVRPDVWHSVAEISGEPRQVRIFANGGDGIDAIENVHWFASTEPDILADSYDQLATYDFIGTTEFYKIVAPTSPRTLYINYWVEFKPEYNFQSVYGQQLIVNPTDVDNPPDTTEIHGWDVLERVIGTAPNRQVQLRIFPDDPSVWSGVDFSVSGTPPEEMVAATYSNVATWDGTIGAYILTDPTADDESEWILFRVNYNDGYATAYDIAYIPIRRKVVAYDDVTDKPILSTVATSGSYDDLSGKPTLGALADQDTVDYATEVLNTPTLSPVATSGAYSDLSGKPTLGALADQDTVDYATEVLNTPTLSPVATSGAYSDLSGKPTLGALASQDNVDYNTEVLNTPSLAPVATSGAYTDLSGKPTLGALADQDTVDYATEVTNTPSLSAVATSGSYNDLNSKPTLGALSSQDTVDYNTEVTNTPSLSSVATSGSYSDLSGKPVLGALASEDSVDYNSTELVNKPTLGALAAQDNVTEADISGSISQSKISSLVTDLGAKLESADVNDFARTGNSIAASDVPTLPQSKISNLTTDLGAKLESSDVNTFARTGNSIQTTDVPTLPQSKISNLVTDLGSKLESANVNTFALSGNAITNSDIADGLITRPKISGGAVDDTKLANAVKNDIASRLQDTDVNTFALTGNSILSSDVPSGIAQSKISNLTTDLASKADSASVYTKIEVDNALAPKLVAQDLNAFALDGNGIQPSDIPDNSITVARLVDGAVTMAKIADGNVTQGKLANGSVSAAKIDNGAIDDTKLASGVKSDIDNAVKTIGGKADRDVEFAANKLIGGGGGVIIDDGGITLDAGAFYAGGTTTIEWTAAFGDTGYITTDPDNGLKLGSSGNILLESYGNTIAAVTGDRLFVGAPYILEVSGDTQLTTATVSSTLDVTGNITGGNRITAQELYATSWMRTPSILGPGNDTNITISDANGSVRGYSYGGTVSVQGDQADDGRLAAAIGDFSDLVIARNGFATENSSGTEYDGATQVIVLSDGSQITFINGLMVDYIDKSGGV